MGRHYAETAGSRYENDVTEPHLFGHWRVRLATWTGLGIVIEGLDGDAPAPADYVNDVLLTPEHREAFFALVDRVGLVVCKRVGGDDSQHRDVRGRSSRGRLSQGEFFHHDGCAGPVKPRIVEIRCPYQEVQRTTFTAIAPFIEVVSAMRAELPRHLSVPDLDDLDELQGAMSRAVRRALTAEQQRAYLRAVDLRVSAYREPWEMGESRFIANSNPVRTMQHRRAYLEPHTGRPNGHLVKRWPADLELVDDDEACAISGRSAGGRASPDRADALGDLLGDGR
jgi:hypothetical protein